MSSAFVVVPEIRRQFVVVPEMSRQFGRPELPPLNALTGEPSTPGEDNVGAIPGPDIGTAAVRTRNARTARTTRMLIRTRPSANHSTGGVRHRRDRPVRDDPHRGKIDVRHVVR